MASTAEVLSQVDPDWDAAFNMAKTESPYKSGSFAVEPVSEGAFNQADLSSAITGGPFKAKAVGTGDILNRVRGSSVSLPKIGPAPSELIENAVKGEYGTPSQYIDDFRSKEKEDQRRKELLKQLSLQQA